jgi:hypothetical protein
MKHHIQKAKEMFDIKIVYNVVIGMLITLVVIKFLALVGWALGMGGHKGMYKSERFEGRGGYMMQEGR